MAKIFYSMSGEGRGHASRAAAIVDNLRHQHDITLFAPHQAFDFLAPRYGARSGVRVERIPGLRFHYTSGRLNLTKSIGTGLQFWGSLSSAVEWLSSRIESQHPDVVITDFEPLLPRAAERRGVPYISFDHQHFLTSYDLSALPSSLRWWASAMKLAVQSHYAKQTQTIVTSFFHCPLLAGHEDTISVGPIVRSAMRRATATRGDYLVSYLRKHTPERVVRELEAAPCEVRVYGLGARQPRGNLKFNPFDAHQFVEDLAGCMALVGAAGNQTLGESLHLGKPVLALPEDRHFEQRINAFYLQERGYGQAVSLSDFTGEHLRQFVRSLDSYIPSVEEVPRNGNADTLAVIRQHLAVEEPVTLVA